MNVEFRYDEQRSVFEVRHDGPVSIHVNGVFVPPNVWTEINL